MTIFHWSSRYITQCVNCLILGLGYLQVSEGSVARATDLHDALPDSEREKGRDLSDSLTRSSLE